MRNFYERKGFPVFDKPNDQGSAPSIDEATKIISEIQIQFTELKSANDDLLVQVKKQGSEDAATRSTVENLQEAITKNEKALETIELNAKRREMPVGTNGENLDLDQKALEWAASAHGTTAEALIEKGGYTHAQLIEYRKGFMNYLRKGDSKLLDLDKKALSVGSDPDGGYTVHDFMSNIVVKQVLETSPMRQYASVVTISTDAMTGLHDLQRANSGWVGETQARPNQDTPQISEWRIPTRELYSSVLVTQKLLDDSSINIEQWIGEKIGMQFGLAENTAFVVGDSPLQPKGFLAYPDGAPGANGMLDAIERIKTGVNGDFAATPAGLDTLVRTIGLVKAPYLANSNWFANRTTITEMRLLKNSDGDYVWQQSAQLGQPSTLFGYAVVNFEDMPAMATGSLSIAFGDMKQTYQIVDRTGIRVLRDMYTQKPYIEIYSTKRTGGDVINFESLKLVEFSE